MAANTDTRSHFSQTSIIESNYAVRSANDMSFEQNGSWSWLSEDRAGHDEYLDVSHGPELQSTFVHYQSPLEFKMDLAHAQAADCHENTILYGLQPAAEREASRTCSNDDAPWVTPGPLTSPNPSLAYQAAGATPRLTTWNCDLAHQVSKEGRPAASPSAACQAQMKRPLLDSRASKPAHHGKPEAVGSSRPRDTAKRRNPAVADEEKARREERSAEKKRRNHIRHENKRRGLIRDGFDSLVNTVPELRGKTWPKATILAKATEFLKSVQEGNQRLHLQIAALSRTRDQQRGPCQYA